MKILNFGSLNLDYVYTVDHMVQPGETLSSKNMEIFCGGKGLNQSIALARAGAKVYHAGCIGKEGQMLKSVCEEAGVDCRYIKTIDGKSGHTIIQVDRTGQNCILLFGGANHGITSAFIDEVLEAFQLGDMLLLQNEVNALDEIVEKAYDKGLMIALNPSPFNDSLKQLDFNKISLFLLNEIEGGQLTGEKEPDQILKRMRNMFPHAKVVLTLGQMGAYYQYKDIKHYQKAYEVTPVDTTAAGDTFTGYFLASLLEGQSAENSLDLAAQAAAIAVCRSGAAPSIPFKNEIKK